MNLVVKLIAYVKIGYLLHLVTLMEILLIIFVVNSQWFTIGHFLVKFITAATFVSLPFFSQLDARSRYQNYKMLRDQFYLYGFQPRIVKPFLRSRCQRDAVKAAADNLGYLGICNKYFYERGYRWYHILPDFILKNPIYLGNKKFWQTTFWTKYYKCRIDYKAICMKKEYLRNVGLNMAVS